MVDFSRASVLVVDNSAAMRHMLCAALAGFGVGRIVEADDCDSARYRVEAETFDAILLDFFLGETDGASFTRVLRRMKDNENRKVPVLLVTALPEHDKLAEIETAGINVMLAKPLSTPDLLVHLGAALTEPRLFVDTPEYVGPCRRMGRREQLTADVA